MPRRPPQLDGRLRRPLRAIEPLERRNLLAAASLEDFNADGRVNSVDIALLSAAVRSDSSKHRFDLHRDGMVTTEDRTVWAERSRGTDFGDADLNARFSTRDFERVFEHGTFEDSVPKSSNETADDWNADTEFTSDDSVLAITHSGYEAGRHVR